MNVALDAIYHIWGRRSKTGVRILLLWKLTGKRKAAGRIFGENAEPQAIKHHLRGDNQLVKGQRDIDMNNIYVSL